MKPPRINNCALRLVSSFGVSFLVFGGFNVLTKLVNKNVPISNSTFFFIENVDDLFKLNDYISIILINDDIDVIVPYIIGDELSINYKMNNPESYLSISGDIMINNNGFSIYDEFVPFDVIKNDSCLWIRYYSPIGTYLNFDCNNNTFLLPNNNNLSWIKIDCLDYSQEVYLNLSSNVLVDSIKLITNDNNKKTLVLLDNFIKDKQLLSVNNVSSDNEFFNQRLIDINWSFVEKTKYKIDVNYNDFYVVSFFDTYDCTYIDISRAFDL